MKEDATALANDMRVTSISRNPSLVQTTDAIRPSLSAVSSFSLPNIPTAVASHIHTTTLSHSQSPPPIFQASFATPLPTSTPTHIPVSSIPVVPPPSTHPLSHCGEAATPTPSSPLGDRSLADTSMLSMDAPPSACMRARGCTIALGTRPSSLTSLNSVSSLDLSHNASMLASGAPPGLGSDISHASKENHDDSMTTVERRGRAETYAVAQTKATRRRTWKVRGRGRDVEGGVVGILCSYFHCSSAPLPFQGSIPQPSGLS